MDRHNGLLFASSQVHKDWQHMLSGVTHVTNKLPWSPAGVAPVVDDTWGWACGAGFVACPCEEIGLLGGAVEEGWGEGSLLWGWPLTATAYE